MTLIRKIVMIQLRYNVRFFAEYVKGQKIKKLIT